MDAINLLDDDELHRLTPSGALLAGVLLAKYEAGASLAELAEYAGFEDDGECTGVDTVRVLFALAGISTADVPNG